MFKIHYKPDLTDSKILKTENILSFHTKSKDDFLPIIELKWEFIWCLLKYKIKRNKIFLLTTPFLNSPNNEQSVEFFRIKLKDKK